MSFTPSSFLVAGQDSDIDDIFFPSISPCFLDVGSSILGKQMYGTTESIKSWINAIDCANAPIFKVDISKDTGVFEFATHPFRTYRPQSPFSDESDVSFCHDASSWAPAVSASSYFDDSDEGRSDSSFSDDAQYITIPPDSPWYRPPSLGPQTGPITAHQFCTTMFVDSCSSDVRQAIAQQDLLLEIFYEELRRAVPRGDGMDYEPDWLEDVDVDLVLAPLETYADLCWESAVCEESPAMWTEKPLPDVPMGFDEVHGIY